MPSLELTAKSVEEARKSAADKLGVAADQIVVTVIEETKGLFGKVQLRVRAETADAAPVAGAPAPAPSEVAEKPAAKAEKPKSTRGGKAKVADVAPEPEPEEIVTAAVELEAEKPAERPARGGRRGSRSAEPAAEPEGGAEAPAEVSEIVATEEDAKNLLAIVENIIEKTGLDVQAQITDIQGRYVNIALDGGQAGYLVGKHGEVINALQYLTNIISNRKYDNGVRSTIECNDYRRRREETLTTMAVKIAHAVLERQEEAVLDALPAFERRIVHKALQTVDGISTYSEGEEPNRRVVIAPAN
jgi:spoIIIJ-associated protein